MNVKFHTQGNNGLSPIGLEPTQTAILRLLVRHVNHSAMPPLLTALLIKILIIISVLSLQPNKHIYYSSEADTSTEKSI
jgi:hypothetical protein